jgi:hypothetical protein
MFKIIKTYLYAFIAFLLALVPFSAFAAGGNDSAASAFGVLFLIIVIGFVLLLIVGSIQLVKERTAFREIEKAFSDHLSYDNVINPARENVDRIAQRYYPGNAEKRASLAVHGWQTAYEQAIAPDGSIECVQDSGRLLLLANDLGIPPTDPIFQEGLRRIIQDQFLRKVRWHREVVPTLIQPSYGKERRVADYFPKDLSVNIKSGETIVWAWSDVDLWRDMNYRVWHGGWESERSGRTARNPLTCRHQARYI